MMCDSVGGWSASERMRRGGCPFYTLGCAIRGVMRGVVISANSRQQIIHHHFRSEDPGRLGRCWCLSLFSHWIEDVNGDKWWWMVLSYGVRDDLWLPLMNLLGTSGRGEYTTSSLATAVTRAHDFQSAAIFSESPRNETWTVSFSSVEITKRLDRFLIDSNRGCWCDESGRG